MAFNKHNLAPPPIVMPVTNNKQAVESFAIYDPRIQGPSKDVYYDLIAVKSFSNIFSQQRWVSL